MSGPAAQQLAKNSKIEKNLVKHILQTYSAAPAQGPNTGSTLGHIAIGKCGYSNLIYSSQELNGSFSFIVGHLWGLISSFLHNLWWSGELENVYACETLSDGTQIDGNDLLLPLLTLFKPSKLASASLLRRFKPQIVNAKNLSQFAQTPLK